MKGCPDRFRPGFAAFLGVLALAACAEGDASAGSPSPDGGGLQFLVDPHQELPLGAAPLRPDGTPEPRPYFHDFGRVRDGGEVRTTYRLRNTDPRPVGVLSVKPSCGCTVPALRTRAADGTVVLGRKTAPEGEPLITVPPDGILEIEIAIDTRHVRVKNVPKLVSVTVRTDSPNRYYFVLEASLVVEVPFNVTPPRIDLGRIARSAGAEGRADIVPATGFHHAVDELLSVPDDVRARLERSDVLGNPRWILHVALDPPLELGGVRRTVLVGTRTESGEAGEPLEVEVTGLVVDDLAFEPSRFVFRAGPDATFSVRLRSLLEGQSLRILGAEVPPEHAGWLSVAFEPEAPGAHGASPSWILTLRTRGAPALAEPARGTLRLRLADPQTPEAHVDYVIHPPRADE